MVSGTIKYAAESLQNILYLFSQFYVVKDNIASQK